MEQSDGIILEMNENVSMEEIQEFPKPKILSGTVLLASERITKDKIISNAISMLDEELKKARNDKNLMEIPKILSGTIFIPESPFKIEGLSLDNEISG